MNGKNIVSETCDIRQRLEKAKIGQRTVRAMECWKEDKGNKKGKKEKVKKKLKLE